MRKTPVSNRSAEVPYFRLLLQSLITYKTGIKLSPLSVKKYSTRTGTSGKICLQMSLSCSNSRRDRTKMRSEACGIARRSSEYRLAPWRSWNSKIGFHLPPIITIVASNAQSRSVSVVLAKSLDFQHTFTKITVVYRLLSLCRPIVCTPVFKPLRPASPPSPGASKWNLYRPKLVATPNQIDPVCQYYLPAKL